MSFISRTVLPALVGGVLAACAMLCSAAPFALDPGFGSSGVRTTIFGSFVDDSGHALASYANALVVLPDGRFLAAGVQQTDAVQRPSGQDGTYERVLARYLTDGTLDASFGVGGVVTLATQGNRFNGAIARQADGKIVVADTVNENFEQFVLVSRYDQDGSPDMTFGTAGVTRINRFPLANMEVSALVVAADGSIVVVGSDIAKIYNRIFAARLTPLGGIDPTFGGGIVVLEVPDAPRLFVQDYAKVVAEQPDGKMVIAGTHDSSAADGNEAFLLRLDPDGTPDAGFGTAGFVTVSASNPSRSTMIETLVLRPHGEIVVGGSHTDKLGTATTPMLIQLLPGGVLDPAFGSGGISTAAPTGVGNAVIHALALQPDGRFVAANSLHSFDSPNFAGAFLSRYDTAGKLDAGFGDHGQVVLPQFASAQAIAEQSDGNWLVGGALEPPNVGPQGTSLIQPFAVARVVAGASPAIEFYRPAADHYFLTINPAEVRDLDLGVHPGWGRTGVVIPTFGSVAAASSISQPVCRFYIPPEHGDSHFMSGSQAECSAVLHLTSVDPNYSNYVLEASAAFFIPMPDTSTGACPPDTLPVYRVWNQRADSNHRYVTSRAMRDAMVAAGWVAEGYGPDAVAMCAPPS